MQNQLTNLLVNLVEKLSHELVEVYGDYDGVKEFNEFVEKSSPSDIIDVIRKSFENDSASTEESLEHIVVRFPHEKKSMTLRIYDLLRDQGTDEMTKKMMKLGFACLNILSTCIDHPDEFKAAEKRKHQRIEKLLNGQIKPSEFFDELNLDSEIKSRLREAMCVFESPQLLENLGKVVHTLQMQR